MGGITSTNPPGTMFVELFCDQCLLAMDKCIMVIPAHPPALCAWEAPGEKLRSKELGPCVYLKEFLGGCQLFQPTFMSTTEEWKGN